MKVFYKKTTLLQLHTYKMQFKNDTLMKTNAFKLKNTNTIIKKKKVVNIFKKHYNFVTSFWFNGLSYKCILLLL